MTQNVNYYCATCDSDNVSRDAWADWDIATQQWVLRCAFDHAHCHDCDCETRLRVVELQSAKV